MTTSSRFVSLIIFFQLANIAQAYAVWPPETSLEQEAAAIPSSKPVVPDDKKPAENPLLSQLETDERKLSELLLKISEDEKALRRQLISQSQTENPQESLRERK